MIKRRQMTVRSLRYCSLLPWAFLIGAPVAYAEEPVQQVDEVPVIEVIGVTPLSSVGLAIDKYAGNVQSLLEEDIENSNPAELSELLIRNIGSINVNTAQSNPYQNDIFYRGFLASSLVGSAVGLSVYVDGVRVNEGFGDTINWDLIPQSAISVINVIPGSNPLFGLNTLGGALVLKTKSGHSFQGTEIEFSGGSWGRRGLELEQGGYRDAYDWYLLANVAEEDSWRTRSRSDVEQLFAKFSWQTAATDIDLSVIYGDTDLIGNGLVSERLFDLDNEAVHTFPDNTINELHHLNLQINHELSELWQVAGNIFHRDYQRSTLNGDAETECEVAGDGVFTNTMGEEGDVLAPSLCTGTVAEAAMSLGQSQLYDEMGNALMGTDVLALAAGGEQRTSRTATETYGGTLQSTFTGLLLGQTNQLTFGLDHGRIQTRFIQTGAETDLQRFGNSVGTVNPGPQELEVDVDTEQRNLGIYFTDTIDVNDSLALTLSGRWQEVAIEIRDRTGAPENADLNGEHDFDQFSPALGISHQLSSETTFFANYSEGFRTPTAAELTCADPDDPCKLPNAFVADPPLDPVLADTIELGIRSQLSLGQLLGNGIFWNAAIYRTQLQDDLLFTQSETGGGGFFQNIGETQRLGFELGLIGGSDKANYFANYAYIEATFESNETLASVVEADGIAVRSGDHIPGIPQHTFKLGADYQYLPNLWLGGDLFATSGSFLRGDESNQLPKTAGYAVFNLNMRAEIGANTEFWAKINNVFDKAYQTVGARNFNANAGTIFGDAIDEERFIAPGAPRAAWIGVKLRY